MPTFLFLAAIYLLVAASILLETDASPPPKTNTLEKGPSSSDNAESTPGLTPENRWVARHEHLTLIDANELIVQSTGEKNGKHSSVSDSAARNKKLASVSAARNKKLAWDSAARAKKLAVIRPAQLIVQFIGENSWNYSVLAEQPIPNDGIFYYEVTILEEGDPVFLATEFRHKNRTVWCRAVLARQIWLEKGQLGRRQVLPNGTKKTTGLFVVFAADLFPCVSLLPNRCVKLMTRSVRMEYYRSTIGESLARGEIGDFFGRFEQCQCIQCFYVFCRLRFAQTCQKLSVSVFLTEMSL